MMSALDVAGSGGVAEVLPTMVSKKQRIQQSELSSVGDAQSSKHAPLRCATIAAIMLSFTQVALTARVCSMTRHQQSFPSTSPGSVHSPAACVLYHVPFMISLSCPAAFWTYAESPNPEKKPVEEKSAGPRSANEVSPWSTHVPSVLLKRAGVKTYEPHVTFATFDAVHAAQQSCSVAFAIVLNAVDALWFCTMRWRRRGRSEGAQAGGTEEDWRA